MVLTTRILQTASLTPKVCTGTFKSSGFTFEEKQGGVGWGRIYTYTFQRVVNSDPNLDPYSATSRIPIHVPIPDPPFRNSTD